MKIDIQMMYFVIITLIFMGILGISTIKKILSIRSKFTTFLMFVEEIIGTVSIGYMVSLAYKAMENYEIFKKQHGSLADIYTYISIYFCLSQIIILMSIWVFKFFSRNRRMIKKRRDIK